MAFCVLPAKKIDKNKKRKMFRKTTEILILTFFFEKFSVVQKKTKESFFAVFLVERSSLVANKPLMLFQHPPKPPNHLCVPMLSPNASIFTDFEDFYNLCFHRSCLSDANPEIS